MGYDHIKSYMNYNQKSVKANWKLEKKLAAEGGIRVEGARGGAEGREKMMWLYGLGTSHMMWFKAEISIYIDSVVLNGLCTGRQG